MLSQPSCEETTNSQVFLILEKHEFINLYLESFDQSRLAALINARALPTGVLTRECGEVVVEKVTKEIHRVDPGHTT